MMINEELIAAHLVETEASHQELISMVSGILPNLFELNDTIESQLTNKQLILKQKLQSIIDNPLILIEDVSFQINRFERHKFHPNSFKNHPSVSNEHIPGKVMFTVWDLKEVVSFSPKMDDAIGYFHRFISLDMLLAQIRAEVASQVFAERVLNKAQESISLFTPNFACENKTVVLTNQIRDGEANNGKYLGVVGNINIVSIDVLCNPFREISNSIASSDFISAVLILVHELIHAKHGELTKEMEFLSERREMDTEDISKHTSQTFYKNSRNANVVRTKDSHAKMSSEQTMNGWVIEGVAVLLEIYIVAQWKKQLKEQGNSDGVQKIQAHVSNRFKNFYEKNDKRPDSYYTGLNLMRKFARVFSIDQIISIIKDIDLEACLNIDVNSPKGLAIIEDPRLLPGLENNQIIINSLKNRKEL
jgi:hypothetical protein